MKSRLALVFIISFSGFTCTTQEPSTSAHAKTDGAAAAPDATPEPTSADDVESDEEHPVLHQFGAHDLGDTQGRLVHFRSSQTASGVDVGAHVPAAAHPPECGVLAFCA